MRPNMALRDAVALMLRWRHLEATEASLVNSIVIRIGGNLTNRGSRTVAWEVD